jgi:NADH:ubiquinone oxidoreductase subunit H
VFSLLVYYTCFKGGSLSLRQFTLLNNSIVFLVWILCCLCEVIRAPFDLSEGERELVRGYNLEFSRTSFVLMFLSEYLSLVFFCWVIGCVLIHSFYWFFIFLFILIVFRRIFVRIRLDLLIRFMWFRVTPIMVLIFIIYI